MSTSQGKGYIYAELDVTDPDYFYTEYMPRVIPVLKEYEAEFKIASNEPCVLEGDRTIKRVILLEFASLTKAREFYHSEAYQAVIGYRFRSAKTHLFMVEGIAQS
jgi:uncharacterized protein (DUF1330 family)